MISRRLTKDQKVQILEAYKAGENSNVLAEKYGCTSNTINRTVRSLLSESEYILLKEKRSKIINKKGRVVVDMNQKEEKKDSEYSNSLDLIKEEVLEKNLNMTVNEDLYSVEVENLPDLDLDYVEEFGENSSPEDNNNLDKENNFDNNFEVIAPLISDFDFDLEKQKSDFEILNYQSLPESVYMIVDKKVELDFQPIHDLPEWSFLPENELQRNAILLFANQRSAKRSCSKNQRVIKIPNTEVFNLSKSYLISKGITRLILEDSIIALDN